MNSYLNSISPIVKDFPSKKYSGLEFESSKKFSSIQDKLLADHVRYTAGNSPYYKALFERHRLNQNSILGVKDLPKIPFTAKKDIETCNKDFLACRREEIADVCLTSATTGDKPNILLQSHSDLARLAYNEEAAFKMMGINEHDTVIICAAMDRCFMAGLAYYLGGLNTGARMVRAGAGSAAQHWHMMKTTGATVIIGVPSLIRKIGQYALDNSEDPKKIGIRLMVAIGESTRDSNLELLPAVKQIEEMWGAPVYSTYASTEMATAFCECTERKGGHVRPELIIAEIVDDNGNPLPPGQTGELVVTPLGVTGMPLIRFKTGDISFLIMEPCGCGRRTPRLGSVLGRKNQMLKLKGTTVFPSSILSVVEGMEGVAGAYIEAKKKGDDTDDILLYIAASPSISESVIAEHLRACIRVVPEIILISEEKLNNRVFQPGKRKKTTFFDLR
jgi:phenylacetate-CoA ligase